MFALNQGEVCTCPSRALIQKSIYDAFLPAATERVKKIEQGNPLDTDTMIGAQAQQRPAGEDPVLHRDRRPRRAPGSSPAASGSTSAATCPAATTWRRRSSRAHNTMRIFQEEIFGPVVAVTGVRRLRGRDRDRQRHPVRAGRRRLVTRTVNTAYRAGRDIQAGRVWTNCYHAYPAHAAFGGYKGSGIGPGEPQDDARPLPADEEPAGVLLAPTPRLLLMDRLAAAGSDESGGDANVRRVDVSAEAADMVRRLRAEHGPADVPPVRRLLRRLVADVLPDGRLPHRRRRRAPRRPRRREPGAEGDRPRTTWSRCG